VRENHDVSTPPDLAELYPDVAVAGSLGAALRTAAVEQGLTFPVAARESDPLGHATVPSVIPHRMDLVVSAWRWERKWSIDGCQSPPGSMLISGTIRDLAEIARAAHAWREGATLADIHRIAPFVELTGRLEVPDQDPVRLTESEWQHLRKEAAETGRPDYQALIEAAYAAPTLRQLYPYTSMWTLRFSTRTRPGLSRVVTICLDTSAEKGYAVKRWNEIIHETATADEAVSLAVRLVPTGLGPVTSGVGVEPW
jgi:hypothetical protein